MPPLLPRGLAMLSVAIACGCALTAKKTPTPAAQITGADLTQLPPTPGDRYFLIFFGSQDALRRPAYTHTWVALVRMPASEIEACGTVTPGCVDPVLDVQTISWLPTKGTIDARNYAVEPGQNFELHETLKLAYDTKQSVDVWGPYEVWHGFAHRFRAQKEFLDGGTVGYQCVDSRGEAARLGNGCDCIHSVTDMDPIYGRWGYPLLYYGKPGTAHAVRRFTHSPIWIDPPRTHDWLLPRLGLDAYPLGKQKYVGRSVPHVPGQAADLDAQARAVLPVAVPEPKGLTPESDPPGPVPPLPLP